jgi:hypothetical protein
MAMTGPTFGDPGELIRRIVHDDVRDTQDSRDPGGGVVPARDDGYPGRHLLTPWWRRCFARSSN